MKKLIVTLFAFLAILFSTFTFSSTAVLAKNDVTITDPGDVFTYVRVYENGAWLIYVYNPGGKVVHIWVESLE
ncbi:MAG TPA: hypothetical protein VIL99_18255 [Ignavibacteria bacterium]